MELDWCLACGRQTDENEAYCSRMCMNMDARRPHGAQSLPIRMPSHRSSSSAAAFDLPALSPPRRTTATQRCPKQKHTPPRCTPTFPSKARFEDDELLDPFPTSQPLHYPGKDRTGILLWARAVAPGLPDSPSSPASSPIDLVASFHIHTHTPSKSAPFPLTAQNLAPPRVTHALLSHTAHHTSSDRDDASLLTPATDSVITPAVSLPDIHAHSGVARLVGKVGAWLAPRSTPSKPPPHVHEVEVEYSPPPTSTASTDITRSSAINMVRPLRSTPRRSRRASKGPLYDIA